MNTKQRSLAITALPIAALVALTGCSSANPSASPSSGSSLTTPTTASESAAAIASAFPEARSAGPRDCGGSDGGNQRVSVKNATNGLIVLKHTEIDCYDWSGKKNPTQFNDQFVFSGSTVGPMAMAVKDMPEWGGQIRPWKFTVFVRTEQGPVLRGTFTDRPTYRFAKVGCNSDSKSNTACVGASLCAQDPQGEQVNTTLPLRGERDDPNNGAVVATLQVKTVCTITDTSATIVISGTLPTA